eukprot:1491752-Prymnesium_polylepis.1
MAAGGCGPAGARAEAQACERVKDGLSKLCARARSACMRFKTAGNGAPRQKPIFQRPPLWLRSRSCLVLALLFALLSSPILGRPLGRPRSRVDWTPLCWDCNPRGRPLA